MAYGLKDDFLRGDTSFASNSARARRSTNWREILVDRYPDLLRDANGVPVGRPAVGDGWARIVVRAIDRILEAAAANDASIRIRKIAEDCGTLRILASVKHGSLVKPFYIGHGASLSSAIAEAVALAEAASECTCEDCGREGILYENDDVLKTRCAAHAVGVPLPVKQGWDNIRIVRHVTIDKVRIVSCRRYERERDAFVDVQPSSLGIEE